MTTDGRPNAGPLDLLYVLKRRKISFEQWCRSNGIETQQHYQEVKTAVKQLGEYFFSPEMDDLATHLPESKALVIVAMEHYGDAPEQAIQPAFEASVKLTADSGITKEEEATEEAFAGQEGALGRKKTRKVV